MMRAVLVWLLMVWAGAAVAQQGPSEAVLQQVQADPAPFLDLATELIHGFGSAKGIDRAGVDRFAALERASARASALRRLAVADLDFDGAVTAEEMGILAASAAAKSRGRLWDLLEKSDINGDRVVSGEEAAAYGRAEAMRAFSPSDEAVARAVLTFDGNADGWVTLDEVRSAVAALAT